MFFSKAGEYKPCGMFTLWHFILFTITITLIIIALKNTINKNKDEVRKIITFCTVILWIIEIIKIFFVLYTRGVKEINSYVPLYYCSLILYAGILSSFGKGKIKRVGDVFLGTGAIIGGMIFTIFPTTSLPAYPVLHFISIHSFLFHGTMIYLGILVNITNYIELEWKDIIYYSILVGIVCIFAYIINKIYGSNLMFISENFSGTPIEIIYNITGKLFTIVMSIGQMILPFAIVYEIKEIIKNIKIKHEKEENISEDINKKCKSNIYE